LPRDHPLLRLDNVIITPHLGSATEQSRQRMTDDVL
jgi:glyoxylate reductase